MAETGSREIDKSNMYDKIVDFPAQFNEGITIGKEAGLKRLPEKKYKNVMLAGMGGSAIAGDLLISLLHGQLKTPFLVNRCYSLPSFIDKDSLVICSSYSGNTEETLTVFEEASRRKCRLLCISTGGELSKKALEQNIPLIKIPAGFMPREALGYSFAPLLIILGRLGICEDKTRELQECARRLDEWKGQYLFESDNNPCRSLAEMLGGKIIVIYSEPEKLGAAARRFKCQICENAKQLAFCNVFPEFNHNELVGWDLSSTYSDKFIVVFLRDREDPVQIARRIDIVQEMISKKKVATLELFTKGVSSLSRIFSIVQVADFTSYYMALKNGVDPTPIKAIDYLKENLSKM
jgi:glucose/mannose-6-phosphate isomerase